MKLILKVESMKKEKYILIPLRNLDAKTLNKIRANQIKQCAYVYVYV